MLAIKKFKKILQANCFIQHKLGKNKIPIKFSTSSRSCVNNKIQTLHVKHKLCQVFFIVIIENKSIFFCLDLIVIHFHFITLLDVILIKCLSYIFMCLYMNTSIICRFVSKFYTNDLVVCSFLLGCHVHQSLKWDLCNGTPYICLRSLFYLTFKILWHFMDFV